MRVIAGSARRLLLKTPEGMDTRPTQDRIKETLFNMIQDTVPGSRFLDLFAGSGGIGIEALSRGASEAVFVDSDRRARECIQDNLEHTHLADRGTLIGRDVFAAIPVILSGDPYDVVFMDPPYDKGYERTVLESMADLKGVNEDTLIIIEAAIDTDFSYVESLGYRLIKEKIYKTNKHVFVEKVCKNV